MAFEEATTKKCWKWRDKKPKNICDGYGRYVKHILCRPDQILGLCYIPIKRIFWSDANTIIMGLSSETPISKKREKKNESVLNNFVVSSLAGFVVVVVLLSIFFVVETPAEKCTMVYTYIHRVWQIQLSFGSFMPWKSILLRQII